ncbi:hypothetical protein OAH23_04565 [Verrucomicrobia bacterium]|nr:hypothetical protein [Verrucomicrobiota bacterium]
MSVCLSISMPIRHARLRFRMPVDVHPGVVGFKVVDGQWVVQKNISRNQPMDSPSRPLLLTLFRFRMRGERPYQNDLLLPGHMTVLSWP